MNIRWNGNENKSIANYQGAIIFIMIKKSLKKNPNMPATFKKFQNLLSFTDRTKGKTQINSISNFDSSGGKSDKKNL